MNATLSPSAVIIGLDTSSSPLRLMVASPDDIVSGAVVPEDWEAFDNLADFSRYWNKHWRNSGVCGWPSRGALPIR